MTRAKSGLPFNGAEVPAPCGAACGECAKYPSECAGCREIEGRVYWLEYTGQAVCAVYDCCVNGKSLPDCGGCAALPCEKFTKDPTISDEENAANLAKMIRRLQNR